MAETATWTRAVRAVPLWLLREYLVELGGRAESDDTVVGVATASMEFGIEFAWWAEMGDLYVLPDARGLGVAKLLVGGIESWLRSRGVAGYQVTVTPDGEDHHGLRAYYRKLGFTGDGRLLLFKEL